MNAISNKLNGYLFAVKQSIGTIKGGHKMPFKTKKARTTYFNKWYVDGKKFYSLYTDSPNLKLYSNQSN